MFNPSCWAALKVPLNFEPVDIYQVTFSTLKEIRDNEEVELMYDFNDNIWWRRDLTEDRELGL